jgi:hypothetical protein
MLRLSVQCFPIGTGSCKFFVVRKTKSSAHQPFPIVQMVHRYIKAKRFKHLGLLACSQNTCDLTEPIKYYTAGE